MKLQSISKKKHWSIKKFTLISALSLLTFSAAHNVTAQLSSSEDNDISKLLPPILDLILNSDEGCSSPTPLNITRATDDFGFRSGNPPENAIDGMDGFNGTVATRWAHNNGGDVSGTNAIITFDLESTATVTDLSISWFRSNIRGSFFSVETSIDGETWTPVLTNTISAQTGDVDGQYQPHDVEDTSANFVRIIGNGNDGGNNFTSINEVIINGCAGLTPSSSSSSSGGTTSTSSSGGTTSTSSSGGTTSTSSSSGGGLPSLDLLDPNAQPWDNFDLSVWGLDSPARRNISDDPNRGTRIDDFDFVNLSNGAQAGSSSHDLFFIGDRRSGNQVTGEPSSPYFFTGPDGGMVFKSPVDGARTSSGARFPRSELREYVRGGVRNRANGNSISTSGANENNWVLGYQPQNLILDDNNRGNRGIENVGGRNGHMTATLRVNKVTETGRDDDIGVTIIGQIHAEDDEPLRLYYRKLPDNNLGSVYFIHEIREDQDDDGGTIDGQSRRGNDLEEVNLVGSRDDDADNPVGGIALDELFSYEIIAQGSVITVILIRGDADGDEISRASFDMATLEDPRDNDVSSGYNRRFEWMYFKAGAYTQNNVAVENGDSGAARTGFGPNGNEADYDQITFYRLNVSHDANDCSQCSD